MVLMYDYGPEKKYISLLTPLPIPLWLFDLTVPTVRSTGSHGASRHVRIIAFPTAEQAVTFLIKERGCKSIVGLLGCLPGGYDNVDVITVQTEAGQLAQATTMMNGSNNKCKIIDNSLTKKTSYPVSQCPFKRESTCIAVGKERHGLPHALAESCDFFVHVPHAAIITNNLDINSAPPAILLDVPSCISITLHHLTNRLGYDERTFMGHKFEVNRQQNVYDGKTLEALRERRVEEKAQKTREEEDVSYLGGLFDGEEDES